jgi:hypothetical protein
LDFKFTLKKLPARIYENSRSYDLLINGRSCKKLFQMHKKMKNEQKLKRIKEGKKKSREVKEMIIKENFTLKNDNSKKISPKMNSKDLKNIFR